jgi:hypothetical protein
VSRNRINTEPEGLQEISVQGPERLWTKPSPETITMGTRGTPEIIKSGDLRYLEFNQLETMVNFRMKPILVKRLPLSMFLYILYLCYGDGILALGFVPFCSLC